MRQFTSSNSGPVAGQVLKRKPRLRMKRGEKWIVKQKSNQEKADQGAQRLDPASWLTGICADSHLPLYPA
jgi:hypothetical protein